MDWFQKENGIDIFRAKTIDGSINKMSEKKRIYISWQFNDKEDNNFENPNYIDKNKNAQNNNNDNK